MCKIPSVTFSRSYVGQVTSLGGFFSKFLDTVVEVLFVILVFCFACGFNEELPTVHCQASTGAESDSAFHFFDSVEVEKAEFVRHYECSVVERACYNIKTVAPGTIHD